MNNLKITDFCRDEIVLVCLKLSYKTKIGKRFFHYRLHLMVVITAALLLGIQTSPNFTVPVTVETLPLTENLTCSGSFVAHDLDHISSVPGGEKVRMFEANGGGVGINDLDNDGDLDIVLANHAGLNTIL